jgi:mannose-1-phosphate guanylyltransferase
MDRSSATAGPLWSIVLAGGEGTRLRPLIQRIHPDGRPKQYAVLVGSRSLLEQTLDRTGLIVAPERTVVVTTRAHAAFFSSEIFAPGAPKILVQPVDRGTAAGVLLPAHWIRRRAPEAIVAVFPSDHFIADDAAFTRHVTELASVARHHPQRIFLVGAEPDSPETGYGWIEPGAEIGKTEIGPIRLVDRFWEKPSPETARACMQRGCLWNTFVMVARVSALVEAGRRTLPTLHERLTRIGPCLGAEAEAGAVERAYALAPTANFSKTVLVSNVRQLGVSRLPHMTWSDWGTPDRVIATLRREGLTPSWLQELAPTA